MTLRLVSVKEEVSNVRRGAMYEKAAAYYCHISINTFRVLVQQGVIPARLRGRQHVFLTRDLDEYLEGLPIDNGANYDSSQSSLTNPMERRNR